MLVLLALSFRENNFIEKKEREREREHEHSVEMWVF
jgi:hypothetical protein